MKKRRSAGFQASAELSDIAFSISYRQSRPRWPSSSASERVPRDWHTAVGVLLRATPKFAAPHGRFVARKASGMRAIRAVRHCGGSYSVGTLYTTLGSYRYTVNLYLDMVPMTPIQL